MRFLPKTDHLKCGQFFVIKQEKANGQFCTPLTTTKPEASTKKSLVRGGLTTFYKAFLARQYRRGRWFIPGAVPAGEPTRPEARFNKKLTKKIVSDNIAYACQTRCQC